MTKFTVFYTKIETNLNGGHQIMNAKLSCAVCRDILGLNFKKELPFRFKNGK